MRIKRPAARPDDEPAGTAGRAGTAPEKGAGEISLLSQPDPSLGATGGEPSVEVVGSLEAMFREISFGDFSGPPPDRLPQLIGKYDELWQLALADPLTGLANRMLLLDRLNRELTRCQRHGGCVIVSHIDLRNLRNINDELGYTSGNEVLCRVTRRLTSMLRSEDTVSRVGESELVAVMTIDNELAVGPLMRRVQDVLDDPIAVTGRDVRLSASLGTVTARSSESAEQVLARAGQAA
jgi:diguanylate cyclase (GGDEF)-like protein